MLTPSHGLLAWLFGRWAFRSRLEMVKFLVLGSLISDIAMIVYGISKFSSGYGHVWDIYLDLYDSRIVKYSTAFLHSFLAATLALSLIPAATKFGIKAEKVKAFLGGYFVFHLFVDFLTHGSYGHEQFWPISHYKFLSPVSDLNKPFFFFDCALSFIALLIFIRFLILFSKKRIKPAVFL